MNLQRLRSVLGKGNQHLGDIVFWQLADARVDRSTLESLWRDTGLDAVLLPEEPTAERALKQAVREAHVGQRDRLIRLGLDSEAEIVFAIVRESHDDAGNATCVQAARVRLDRTSEAINSDVTSHDIVQAVFAGFRTLRTQRARRDLRMRREKPGDLRRRRRDGVSRSRDDVRRRDRRARRPRARRGADRVRCSKTPPAIAPFGRPVATSRSRASGAPAVLLVSCPTRRWHRIASRYRARWTTPRWIMRALPLQGLRTHHRQPDCSICPAVSREPRHADHAGVHDGPLP
jgi:hypothetical protein